MKGVSYVVRHRNTKRVLRHEKNNNHCTDLVESGEESHDPRVRRFEDAAVSGGRSLQNLGDKRRDRDESTRLVPLLTPTINMKPRHRRAEGRQERHKTGKGGKGSLHHSKRPHYQYKLLEQLLYVHQVRFKRTHDLETDLYATQKTWKECKRTHASGTTKKTKTKKSCFTPTYTTGLGYE